MYCRFLEQVTTFILPFAATVTWNVEIHWSQVVTKKRFVLQCYSQKVLHSMDSWWLGSGSKYWEYHRVNVISNFDSAERLPLLNTSETKHWSIAAETRKRNTIRFGLRIAFRYIWIGSNLRTYMSNSCPQWTKCVVSYLLRWFVLPCSMYKRYR